MPFPSRRTVLLAALSGPLTAAPPVYTNKHDLLYYLDAAGQSHKVHNRATWEKRRRHILDNIQLVTGPVPSREGTPSFEVVEQFEEARFWRRRIRYRAEADDWVPAWLLVPKNQPSKAPAVVCLHQTTKIGKDEPVGLGGKENLRYAQELGARGYVTLAPDYPNFGGYTIDVYSKGYASATMKGIFNHSRGVDLLRALPFVRKESIGVIGHSLGGHNSLFLAVFDSRVQAVVTSCGFTAFPKYYGGNLTGWSHNGYMPRIATKYEKSPQKMPFDFPEILAAIAPRGIFINAPKHDANFEVSGVEDCVRAARTIFDGIYHRPETLVVEYPDAAHDFPPHVRERSYAFLDRVLRG